LAAHLFLKRLQDRAGLGDRAIVGGGRLGPEGIQRLDLVADELGGPVDLGLPFRVDGEIDHG
jgi:hypothetical protein